MQSIDITFLGVSNALPDDLNPNGQLAMGFNLTTQGVVSTPICPTVTHLHGIDGGQVIYVHVGTDFKNVIVYFSFDDIRIYRFDDLTTPNATPTPLTTFTLSAQPTSITAVGNVIAITTSAECRYLYRNGEAYDVRSNSIPPLSLELTAFIRKVQPFGENDGKIQYDDPYESDHIMDGIVAQGNFDGTVNFDELTQMGRINRRAEATDSENAVIGQINQLLAQWSAYGYLFSPVLVRAAYRLKSGELACLTNPVLCFPFEKQTFAVVKLSWPSNHPNVGQTFLQAFAYKPFVKIGRHADVEAYKDLIESVEIYMSAPIYTHSVEPRDVRYIHYKFNDEHTNPDISQYHYGYEYIIRSYEGVFSGRTDSIYNYNHHIIIPGEKKSLSYDNLERVSQFYKVRSIPFTHEDLDPDTPEGDYRKEIYYDVLNPEGITSHNELVGFRNIMTRVENGEYVHTDASSDSIVTLPAMTDALRSNIENTPVIVTAYNSRLIAVGDKYDVSSLNNVQPSFFSGTIPTLNESYANQLPNFTIPYELNRAEVLQCLAVGKDVSSGVSFAFSPRFGDGVHLPLYLTCEEPYTSSLYVLAKLPDNGKYLVAQLGFATHDFLSLAYYKGQQPVSETFSTLEEAQKRYAELTATEARLSSLISHPDRIRASAVADPYTFDEADTAWFNSPVCRLLVTPEAISLGQYGTSQLYAVCRDGIYTVDVDAQGHLAAVHTYTADVVTHPERATVMSKQMLVNGDISWDVYTGQKKQTLLDLARNFAFSFNLPLIERLPGVGEWHTLLADDAIFRFLRSATLSYDAAGNQLVASLPGAGFIALWRQDFGLHLIPCPAERPVTSNHLILTDDDQNLYDFSQATLADSATGFFITRPIHLGDDPRNGRATLRSVILRGQFNEKQVALILYATNDYRHYHPVASARGSHITAIAGTPFRAYKIAAAATLSRDQYISHISLVYDQKETTRTHF